MERSDGLVMIGNMVRYSRRGKGYINKEGIIQFNGLKNEGISVFTEGLARIGDYALVKNYDYLSSRMDRGLRKGKFL